MTSMMSVGIQVDTAKLDRILSPSFLQNADKIVGRSAMRIESLAKQAAPILTGALRNSIMAGRMPKPMFWDVSDGVEYGIFQELGTSRGVVAKYFLTGAAEAEAENFFNAVFGLFP